MVSIAVDLVPDTAGEWTMVATFLIAVVAWLQLNQLRTQARRADRAHVVVSPEADRDTHALNFVVANVGRTYATEVSISWDQPIESVNPATSKFDEPALWNPPFLGPGETYRTVLDMSHERSSSELPMSYRASVTWKSPTTDRGRIFKAEFDVDFTRFYAMREWRAVDRQPTVEALNRIAEAINSLDLPATSPLVPDPTGWIEAALGLADTSEEE